MKTNWPTKKLGAQMKTTVMIEKRIKRGKESWIFIYSAFGILFALTAFFISTLPIIWYFKITVFMVATLILIYLCLCSVWFQNKLIGLKIKLEETWRKI